MPTHPSTDGQERHRFVKNLQLILGAAAWSLLWLVSLGLAERLLALALCLSVPIGLRVLERPVWVRLASGLAAVFGLFSFLLPVGPRAAGLAMIWAISTGVVALTALWPAPERQLRSLLASAGGVYLAVGGAWMVVARWGQPFMGFDPLLCLLTANHFHYAGFAAPILASRAPRLPAWAGWSILVCPILIAIGITALPLLEWMGAVLFAGALIALAVLNLGADYGGPAVLTRLSWAALLVSMPLAAVYALGQSFPFQAPSIPWMILSHGLLNAVVFSLGGLAGELTRGAR
ncbi:MAG: YndJ family transporter [Vulcanimicrobiota bacterium]